VRWKPTRRRLSRRLGEVRQRAVRDYVHAVGIDPELQQPAAPMRGVHDNRVEALVQSPLGGQLARPRLARQHVVGGEHQLRACPRRRLSVP
jgi:hypothetical protein